MENYLYEIKSPQNLGSRIGINKSPDILWREAINNELIMAKPK